MAIAVSGVRLLLHAAGLYNIDEATAVEAADGTVVFGLAGADNGLNGLLMVAALDGDSLGAVNQLVVPQATGGLPFTKVQRLSLQAGPDGKVAALYSLPEHGIGTGDTGRSIWMQRVDGGTILGDALPVSPADPMDLPSIYSSLVWLPGGDFVVLTVDDTTPSAQLNPVTLQRFDDTGIALGTAVTVVPDGPAGGFVTVDRNPMMVSAALLENGRIAMTWTESSAFAAPTFGQPQVKMQILRADGSVTLAPVVVDGTSAQRSQVVALDGGGFVVGWQDYAVGSQGIFKAQVYSGSGRAIGTAFEISSTLSPQEGNLSLTALRSGGFAAVWTDMQDNTWLARMFDATGKATGADFLAIESEPDFIYGSARATAVGDRLMVWMHGGNPAAGDGFVLQAQDWSTQSSWGLVRDGGKAAEALNGSARDDRLDGRGGADTLKGGNGNDLLAGGASRDLIAGGGGRDQLDGGDGSDTLSGGADGDSFVFRLASDGGDRITDFNGAEGDRLVFYKDGFGGATGVLSGAVVNTAHQGLFFDTTTAQLTYDADGSGAEARVLIARLIGVSALAFDDLVFL